MDPYYFITAPLYQSTAEYLILSSRVQQKLAACILLWQVSFACHSGVARKNPYRVTHSQPPTISYLRAQLTWQAAYVENDGVVEDVQVGDFRVEVTGAVGRTLKQNQTGQSHLHFNWGHYNIPTA